MRQDGRRSYEIRPLMIQVNPLKDPEGSVLISLGDTKVLCCATVEERSEALKGTDAGRIKADYNELPRSSSIRKKSEMMREKASDRSKEISQLIVNSLKTVTDLTLLGEKMILIDCVVIQNDGATMMATVNGAFIAFRLAIDKLLQKKVILKDPIKEILAASVVGILNNGECVVDLTAQEEKQALAEMFLVKTESGGFVEMHILGDSVTFAEQQLNECMVYGQRAIDDVIAEQKERLSLDYEATVQLKPKTIIIATRNKGKAREFATMFQAAGYAIKTLDDFPDIPDVKETGTTFEENARLKAETIATLLKCPVLADDSGLKVDALDGRPGVYSARFAGEQKSDAANNAKLLYELTNVPDEQRTAQFHCTLVFAAPNKDSLVVEAQWPGRVGRIPRGENGFGYDPLFVVGDTEKTAAELSESEKNAISHRGQAMQKLKDRWQDWLEGTLA